MKPFVVITFTFALFHCSHSSGLSVPLIAWGVNSDIKTPPPSSFGHTAQLTDVYKQHLQPLVKSKAPVLIFLQDQLSKDDFTKYPSSFPHLQKVLSTSQSVFFPAVSKSKRMEELVEATSSTKVEYISSSELTEWKYTPSTKEEGRVFVFNLEPVSGSDFKGKGEILSRNDLLLHRIVKTVSSQVDNAYVIYTSEEPSTMVVNWLFDEKISQFGAGFGRHLLADSAKINSTGTFLNNSMIYMWASSIKFTLDTSDKGHNTTEEFLDGNPESWDQAGENTSLVLTRKGKVGLYSEIQLTIDLQHKVHTGEWFCKKITLQGKWNETAFKPFEFTKCGDDNTTAFDATAVPIVAPIGMSFSCASPVFAQNTSELATGPWLAIGNLQLEPVGLLPGPRPKGFSGAHDCVGFFTIEILTGIFVAIVLGMGLYIGVMMMMAIQVQDRLDDPKGKTISMAVVNE